VDLSALDIAYISGVIDVQARIRVTRVSSGTRLPLISLSTPSIEVVGYLGRVTAVRTFSIDRDYHAHRCAEHCPDRHQHRLSTSGRWSLNGAKATVVLSAILPHLKFQIPDAEVALKVGLEAPHKPATPQKLYALGWPVPKEWQQ
jgi:hypothetical protein